jgi:hypothetical protein
VDSVRRVVEGNHTATSVVARDEFSALRELYGKLSLVEEALILPVCVCMSVLRLPSGGQLGYRGNVISFTLGVGQVSARIPLALCFIRRKKT